MSLLVSLASGAPVVGFDFSDTAPLISAGGARWEAVDRPKRPSFTSFSGVDPYEQTIKVWLDRWPDGDCEAEIRLLEDRQQLTGGATPDILRLTGDGVKRTDLLWVLTGVSEETGTLYRDDGRRCRYEATLTFMQYIESEIVIQNTSPAAAAQAR